MKTKKSNTANGFVSAVRNKVSQLLVYYPSISLVVWSGVEQVPVIFFEDKKRLVVRFELARRHKTTACLSGQCIVLY